MTWMPWIKPGHDECISSFTLGIEIDLWLRGREISRKNSALTRIPPTPRSRPGQPVQAISDRRSCCLSPYMNHMRHDRFLSDHFRREPYPFKRDPHGGSSLAGAAAGRGSLPRRVSARSRVQASMIQKSGNRFSEEIILTLKVRTAARLDAS
jgi:hypothetical protein